MVCYRSSISATISVPIKPVGCLPQVYPYPCWSLNAGRKEFLTLPTWDHFEKKVSIHFMAKGYRLLVLCISFLCAKGKHPFRNMQITWQKPEILPAQALSPLQYTSPSYSSTIIPSSFTSWLCPILMLITSQLTTWPPLYWCSGKASLWKATPQKAVPQPAPPLLSSHHLWAIQPTSHPYSQMLSAHISPLLVVAWNAKKNTDWLWLGPPYWLHLPRWHHQGNYTWPWFYQS